MEIKYSKQPKKQALTFHLFSEHLHLEEMIMAKRVVVSGGLGKVFRIECFVYKEDKTSRIENHVRGLSFTWNSVFGEI